MLRWGSDYCRLLALKYSPAEFPQSLSIFLDRYIFSSNSLLWQLWFVVLGLICQVSHIQCWWDILHVLSTSLTIFRQSRSWFNKGSVHLIQISLIRIRTSAPTLAWVEYIVKSILEKNIRSKSFCSKFSSSSLSPLRLWKYNSAKLSYL